MDSLTALMGRIVTFIIDPLIALLLIIGLLYFFWGLAQFIKNASAQGEEKENGKRHMIYGIIGLFIMTAAIGILKILTNTFGLQSDQTVQRLLGL